jgi:hypothetical protein
MTAAICRPSLALLLAGLGACASSPDAPDASPAPVDAGAGERADGAAPDRAADLRSPPSGLPLPAGVAPPRRLFQEPARLTGGGPTGCSHQEPATGDGHRWCVFSKPGASATETELWTIDASAAEAPACDGSSPACVRLTSKLWTEFPLGGPVHPYSHEFFGDTLIYYAEAVSRAHEQHRGPVFGWRPGWTRPHRISSDGAVMCWGHARLPIAHCLEDLAGPVMMPDLVELRAGAITDSDGIALSSLGWIRAFANGAPSWQAGFSPRGDLFGISSPDPDPAVEALRVVATGELGQVPPREVVRDASSWEISPQGRHVLFFRRETRDARVLHVADLPSGASPMQIASNVRDFLFVGEAVGDDSIIYVTESDPDHGALRLLRDPGNPASATTVFTYTDQFEDVRVSDDLRFTAWEDAHFQIRVVDHGKLGSCELNSVPGRAGFVPLFLASAGLVFWIEESAADIDRRDGWLAEPTGCAGKRRFGQDVELILPVGDRGVVFTDELDPVSSQVTLKYAAIAGGKEWPAAGPVRIHGDVDGSSVFLIGSPAGARPVLVSFRVVGGPPAEQGTYVFPLPL